jgi:hypothetical protein
VAVGELFQDGDGERETFGVVGGVELTGGDGAFEGAGDGVVEGLLAGAWMVEPGDAQAGGRHDAGLVGGAGVQLEAVDGVVGGLEDLRGARAAADRGVSGLVKSVEEPGGLVDDGVPVGHRVEVGGWVAEQLRQGEPEEVLHVELGHQVVRPVVRNVVPARGDDQSGIVVVGELLDHCLDILHDLQLRTAVRDPAISAHPYARARG